MRPGEADILYRSFVAGERRAPPEDVSGTTCFADSLEAVSDPGHEEHDIVLDWCGGIFEPEDLEERLLRTILSDFAARRCGPLMSHRSSGRTKQL